MLKCVVKECGRTGMNVHSNATVTATQCEFMENGQYGVYCRHVDVVVYIYVCMYTTHVRYQALHFTFMACAYV